MASVSKVIFDYRFANGEKDLPYKKSSPVNALYVEGDFTIKINDTIYFEEEYFPLSEFYLYLHD